MKKLLLILALALTLTANMAKADDYQDYLGGAVAYLDGDYARALEF